MQFLQGVCRLCRPSKVKLTTIFCFLDPYDGSDARYSNSSGCSFPSMDCYNPSCGVDSSVFPSPGWRWYNTNRFKPQAPTGLPQSQALALMYQGQGWYYFELPPYPGRLYSPTSPGTVRPSPQPIAIVKEVDLVRLKFGAVLMGKPVWSLSKFLQF